MNPCPCGFFGDARRACVCSPTQIRRYLARLSGPLLDRIDLHVEVPRLNAAELMNRAPGESSVDVRERVVRARERQLQRFGNEGIGCNAQLRAKHLRVLPLEDAARDLLKTAIHQFSLSARAYDRILKVAQTISDLDASDTIQLHHIAEAISSAEFAFRRFSQANSASGLRFQPVRARHGAA